MDEIRVPIYLITGFLESGKTTFLNFTLNQDYFEIEGKTLLILCEEGEEEYDLEALKQRNTVVEIIEKEEDGVWNVSGPRLERVFDINKLNTEEDFYLFANKMRYLGIDTALREAGCQDGDTVRLLGFEFEFIEN